MASLDIALVEWITPGSGPRILGRTADPDLVDQGWLPYRRVNPNIGLRGGYYPLSFLGFEGELGVPARNAVREEVRYGIVLDPIGSRGTGSHGRPC